MEESQGEREPHLREKGNIRAGALKGKGGIHSEGRRVVRRIGKASKQKSLRNAGESIGW